jgi:acyl carrier protein
MQWLDYRRGELCAWALLLGATEQRAMFDPGTRAGTDAADWARARFEAARLALAAGAAVRPAASELLARIDGYADAIGDVEQALAGEADQLDPLLQRAAPPARPAEGAPAAEADMALSATHRLVHESVMKWLRSEGAGECEPIGYETPFTELGMDSLATVPIALELEQQTALPIAPELLYDYQTVNALAAYIDTRRRDAAMEEGTGVAPVATR